VWIVLAYLWPLAFVPLVLERDDPEVLWHARHGILLMAVELAVVALYLTVSAFLDAARFGLGGAVLIAIVAGWAGVFALHIAAIVKGLAGARLFVPGLSRLLP